MADVDDKVVSMRFDNAAFQRNLAETIQSLDKLRQSLNFADSTRGMNELSAVSKRFDMSSMGNAIDGISTKFLALATIGVTALSRLTNSVISAGARFAKSFTIAPVMAGFNEFETNMGSIQTILSNTASKGTDLRQVSAALDELNQYSDQTIYNFGQMARNIGTFTAAGVDLQTATMSIKGIANLAALSGSSAEQAATAMYQLSQAISTGSVKLMDWNSVVNAGLGGEVFQKALFESGKALGTLKNVPIDQTFEQWKAAGNSFRNSLSETGNAVESTADKMAKATKQTAKEIAAAKRSQVETSQNGAESIKRAEENQVKTIERAAKDVQRAVEAQSRTVADNAKTQQNAIDRVTQAQLRLQKAMEPTSVDDMQAATDNLTLAQLDQKDLVNEVTAAENAQKKAEQDLIKARNRLANAATDKQRASSAISVASSEKKLLELTEEATRARIKQNSATRNLHQAEASLTDAKKKGTSEDENVIDANDALLNAQNEYLQVQKDNVQREIDAADAVKNAELSAAEARVDAIKSVSEARSNAAEADARASERLADVMERSAERVAAANESTSGMRPGWLTDKVLTSTLSAFTGDLDEAQLMAMGYTKEQAAEMIKLGKIGKAAATEVKTFTQLMGTIKEAIGSGWSATFRSVIGDFNQSKELFTNINNVVGGMISRSADARNKILKDWGDLGGRGALIQGFENAFSALGKIIGPIKDAFRDIFPRMTGQRLFELTQMFVRFTEGLKATRETSENIKRTFRGLFAVLEIGWTIFKGIIGLIVSVVKSLSPAGSGILGFTGNIGDMLVALNKVLVDGGAINKFFQTLAMVIKVPIVFLRELTSKIIAFFKSFSENEVVADGLNRIEGRFESLRGVSDRFSSSWERLAGVFEGFKKVLSGVGEYIRTWFSELGSKLAAAFKPGDFNAAVDILNVGLLGGIIFMLKKFLSGDFLKNIGGGFLEKVTGTLDALTGQLKAMQANVKADTLMKIAIAMGILTAALLVLSLINSVDLTKALTAMAVGFGELVGAMAVLNAVASGPRAAVTLGILVAAMIGLAGAMVILAGAVKILSTIDPDRLAAGIAGMTASLIVLTAATKLVAVNTAGIISGSIAMIFMAGAMIVLAGAIKIFSDMSWAEIGKGLLSVGLGLVILAGTMSLMPVGQMLAAGLALIPIAIGIGLLAGAVKAFAILSWDEIGKGLLSIGLALVILAGAMHLMPLTLPLTAAGLILVGVALNVIALAIRSLGSMNFGALAKGIGGFTVMLLILGAAMEVMTGTAAGAAAMLVAAGALLILAGVLKVLGDMKISAIVTGLAAMAGVFIILGVAAAVLTPVIPMLLSLGAAMLVLGGGFALFGTGAYLVAKAFEALAKAGKAGVIVLLDVIKRLLTALPEFAVALVKSLLGAAGELLNSGDLLLRIITTVLLQLLESVIKLAPKIGEAFGVIISTGLRIIREKFPEVLATGLALLLELIRGVRDNIGKVIDLGADTAANFITGIGRGALKLVNAAADMVIDFLNGLAEVIRTKGPEIIDAGFNIAEALGEGFLKGLEKIPILGEVIKLGAGVVSGLKSIFDMHSPSKVSEQIGRYFVQGLAIGLSDEDTAVNSSKSHAKRIVSAFKDTLSKDVGALSGIGQYSPVITPVLDLSRVQADAGKLSGLIAMSAITPNVSLAQARHISTTADLDRSAQTDPVASVPSEVRFEQNIYAPTALSTNDIYRNTRSQIALAKEELAIP